MIAITTPERTVPRGFVLLTVVGMLNGPDLHRNPSKIPTRLRLSLIDSYETDEFEGVTLVRLGGENARTAAVAESPEEVDSEIRAALRFDRGASYLNG